MIINFVKQLMAQAGERLASEYDPKIYNHVTDQHHQKNNRKCPRKVTEEDYEIQIDEAHTKMKLGKVLRMSNGKKRFHM